MFRGGRNVCRDTEHRRPRELPTAEPGAECGVTLRCQGDKARQ